MSSTSPSTTIDNTSTQVVQHQMDERDLCGNLAVQQFEELNELHLSFALVALPVHLAGSRIERGEQVQRALPLVLVFDAHRQARFGRQRRCQTRPRATKG